MPAPCPARLSFSLCWSHDRALAVGRPYRNGVFPPGTSHRDSGGVWRPDPGSPSSHGEKSVHILRAPCIYMASSSAGKPRASFLPRNSLETCTEKVPPPPTR